MSTPSMPPPLPSVDELLQLVGAAPGLLPVEELLAGEYKTNPFEAGMVSDDFRRQHRDYGEQVRWWKAFPKAGTARGPNGEEAAKGDVLYIEQTIPAAVRVLFTDAKNSVKSGEIGDYSTGEATISCLPDEIELARGDIVMRVERTVLYRHSFAPSGTESDSLPHKYVASIECVLDESGPLSPSTYTATQTGIHWTGGIPDNWCLVEYRAHSVFEYLGESDPIPVMGTDDRSLPQIGALQLLNPKHGFFDFN